MVRYLVWLGIDIMPKKKRVFGVGGTRVTSVAGPQKLLVMGHRRNSPRNRRNLVGIWADFGGHSFYLAALFLAFRSFLSRVGVFLRFRRKCPPPSIWQRNMPKEDPGIYGWSWQRKIHSAHHPYQPVSRSFHHGTYSEGYGAPRSPAHSKHEHRMDLQSLSAWETTICMFCQILTSSFRSTRYEPINHIQSRNMNT